MLDVQPNLGLLHLEDLRQQAQLERAARRSAVSWRRRAAQALLGFARRLEPDLLAERQPARQRA